MRLSISSPSVRGSVCRRRRSETFACSDGVTSREGTRHAARYGRNLLVAVSLKSRSFEKRPEWPQRHGDTENDHGNGLHHERQTAFVSREDAKTRRRRHGNGLTRTLRILIPALLSVAVRPKAHHRTIRGKKASQGCFTTETRRHRERPNGKQQRQRQNHSPSFAFRFKAARRHSSVSPF